MANFKNLINLSVDKEGTILSTTTLTPALKAAMEARKKKAAEDAAEELVILLDKVEDFKSVRRREIRRLRKMVEDQKKKLVAIDLMFNYGQETGNFLPLLKEMDVITQHYQVSMDEEEFKLMSKMPSNWAPTSIPQKVEE